MYVFFQWDSTACIYNMSLTFYKHCANLVSYMEWLSASDVCSSP